jgi:hypothetical protein
MSFEKGQDLQTQRELFDQIEDETRTNGGRKRKVETKERRYGVCGQTGYNARTCDMDIESSEEDNEN